MDEKPKKQVRIEITVNGLWVGELNPDAGDVIEVDQETANHLIARKQAKRA